MKIKSITFENYKSFLEKQNLELKPITILIGKNSSGKSSIAKLFTLLENSLSGSITEPLLVKNNNVELGAEFIDLIHEKSPSPLNFSIDFENGPVITVSIVQEKLNYKLDIIEWSYRDSDQFLKINYSPEKGYTDAEGKKYECEFRGIIPVKLLNEHQEDVSKKLNLNLQIDVDYIGPFRIIPERTFHLSGQVEYRDTGIKGENAYFMLGASKLLKGELHQKVGEWYKNNFDGFELRVEDNNRPSISILLSKNSTSINIVDVGQGMNQSLPLVVRSNISRPNSLIVLEQPELHLHPAAHSGLAELFSESAKKFNQTFLIETHSENFLLRLRKLVIENSFGFTNEDVIIYWINNAELKGQELNEIKINKDGTLTNWPDGVFNEDIKEILEIQKALEKKGISNL